MGATVKTHIDTSDMNEARKAFDTALTAYKERKGNMEKSIKDLLDSWEGDGKNSFEKDYLLFSRQMEDLLDVLMDLRTGIIEAETKFIETDAEISKTIASS